MDIEEILKCFNHPNSLPIEALNAAQKMQEKITPRLLSILEHTLLNYKNISFVQMDYIFALYLLSKFREKKAFPYVIALARLPGRWPEKLLDEGLTEGLASFIILTFNDDLSAIKNLIEDPTLNEWSRHEALNSLLGLVALKKLQRGDLIAYLRFLFHSPLAEDEFFVTHLVEVASDLYPEELMDEINKAFDGYYVDDFFIEKSDIDKVLEQGKEETLLKNIYNNAYYLPIEDLEKKMLWISDFYAEQEKNSMII